MGDIEKELVGGGVEDLVEGDTQFHDSEVGPQVAAGIREGVDQDLTDFFGEIRKAIHRYFFEVVRALDLSKEGIFRRV